MDASDNGRRARPEAVLALTNARVLLPDGVADAAVLVEGDRIAGIDASVPAAASVLDLAGATLLPGFIDTHVHMQFASPQAVLAGGVTAVRDLGSPPAARGAATRSPLRLAGVGRILTPRGGYPAESWGSDGTAREIDGPEDGRRAVAEQIADAAGWIKVALEGSRGRPLFDRETLGAIVAAAHGHGRRVTAHVGTPEALALALDAGADELAHLPLYDVAPDEMRAVAAAGMTLVPTLEIRGADRRAPRAVAAFREAGGRVLYGTDLGNDGTAPGIEVAEVRALLASGLGPRDVVAAATDEAARYLGWDDSGEIRVGFRADLVAFDGNPLADPAAYDRVRLVVAAGRVVARG